MRRFKPSTVSRRLSVVTCFYRTCVIDAVLDASPAAYVRRPPVSSESPTLGLSHLQFEAMIVAARTSTSLFDFALVALLGLLGLRVFEACNSTIDDLGEEHGHRILRVLGKGTKLAMIPLPPAVGRAIDRAVGDRERGPILLNRNGNPMDRHAATRRLRRLASAAGVRMPRMHPHMLSHFTSPPCSTPASASATSRSPPVMRTPRPRCATTGLARISTGTRTTSWPRTWPPELDRRSRNINHPLVPRTVQPIKAA